MEKGLNQAPAAGQPNRLIGEKSPYLLQHAYNPVDWYAWGSEAFEKARREVKPIFLSIGYSTCHWCHVMEHESFENDRIAEMLNESFVCIKVDREERPDVDKVYMSAVQAMTGSGGWPLSVFLTPDLKPFYGGTYFPPTDARGRPGLPTVLERIRHVWETEREKVLQSGSQLINLLQHRDTERDTNAEVDDMLVHAAYRQFAAEYDPRHGGFGPGPKFPRPAVLNFLFRYHARTKDAESLAMSLTTLQSMARGGVYDHLGGGFHRYSVDGQWRVPHFEKMLYDQAQLVEVYLDAYQLTHEEVYATIARETLDYVLRDLTDPAGGFCSAEDADSPEPDEPRHSSEGAFYLWQKSEIDKVLGPDDARIFCHYYGVDGHGNALSDPSGEFKGKNILFAPFTLKQAAEFLSMGEEQVESSLRSSKQRLFEMRYMRPRPFRDDKIITAWNGLMIGAFARASQVLGEPRYGEAAGRAKRFLFNVLYDERTKTLKRRYRDGEAKLEAHLDDYAFCIQALLALYETTFETGLIKLALDLQGSQESIFGDNAEGGYYDFSGSDPSLLLRPKEIYDGAEPSGNSVAAMNLARLARITGSPLLRKKFETTLKLFVVRLREIPSAMPSMISAIDFWLSAPQQIVISGRRGAPSTGDFLDEIARHYLPSKIVLLVDGVESRDFLAKYLPFLASVEVGGEIATAYVCNDFVCGLPVRNSAQFLSQLLAT